MSDISHLLGFSLERGEEVSEEFNVVIMPTIGLVMGSVTYEDSGYRGVGVSIMLPIGVGYTTRYTTGIWRGFDGEEEPRPFIERVNCRHVRESKEWSP